MVAGGLEHLLDRSPAGGHEVVLLAVLGFVEVGHNQAQVPEFVEMVEDFGEGFAAGDLPAEGWDCGVGGQG